MPREPRDWATELAALVALAAVATVLWTAAGAAGLTWRATCGR